MAAIDPKHYPFIERARAAINRALEPWEQYSAGAFIEVCESDHHIVYLYPEDAPQALLTAYVWDHPNGRRYLYVRNGYNEGAPALMRAMRRRLTAFAREHGFDGLATSNNAPAFGRYVRPTRSVTTYFEEF